VKDGLQDSDELAAEDAAKNLNGQKESARRADPSVAAR
jgi:hypothetical protein